MINKNITPEIAQICGIIAGDGHLCKYITSKRNDYRIDISGNKTEEIDYFNYVSCLFNNSFGRPLKLKFKKNYLSLYIHSKEFVLFFENIGIPTGKKSDIVFIPEGIKNDLVLACSFLRGLADTDFSISFKKGDRKQHSYPVIVGTSVSKRLIQDVSEVLTQLEIKHNIYTIKTDNNFGKFENYRIEINGRNNYDKWMNFIGFSNTKHLTKIAIWKKQGYCPPNTTYLERIKKLKEK